MALESGNSLATPLIQVLLLILAGFAAMLLRIYETDADKLESGNVEVLSWYFMSISIIFIYPAFLLTLVLLIREGGLVIEYVAYLLGIFITIPILLLTSLNFYIGVLGSESIELPFYQRLISCVSSLVTWALFVIIIISYFWPQLPFTILN
jgi:hypothetical protein